VDWHVAKVGVTVGGERFESHVPVPDGPARPRDVVRTAQVLTEAIVDRGVANSSEPISCRKGCGACCRQVVPISQPEARLIAEVLEQMPEPRRSEVRARFADALEKLSGTDLPERMRHADTLEADERQRLALDYFRQGIACPFLEDEACSIYENRPLACREYLVTTPAVNCSVPTLEPVVRVPLAGRMSVALGQLEPTSTERSVWWIPLVLAPQWAEANPEEPEPRPPVDVLRDLLEWLARTG
jgi:Fe-S-cluster containining protein